MILLNDKGRSLKWDLTFVFCEWNLHKYVTSYWNVTMIIWLREGEAIIMILGVA
jgi:hypothetical protein